MSDMSEQWTPGRVWLGIDPSTGKDIWDVEQIVPRAEVIRLGRIAQAELNRKRDDADG